jgi:hypothetical protein
MRVWRYQISDSNAGIKHISGGLGYEPKPLFLRTYEGNKITISDFSINPTGGDIRFP